MSEEQDESQVDLGQYGKVELNSGDSKPNFEKNIVCHTGQATVHAGDEKEDKAGKTYIQWYVKVPYKTDDGQEAWENYGGIHKYSEENIWIGPESAFGRLRQKAMDTFDVADTLGDIITAISNKRVMIKTELSTVRGKEYKKNIIQSFIPDTPTE